MDEKLERIFEKTLKEANTEKVYKGGNPNSLAAWIYIDISPTQNGRILLNDKYENFEWNQSKSNDCVKGISNTGSGEGKGFSFYFARYGYDDNYKYRDKSLSTNTEKDYSGFLASVNFGFLEKRIGSKLPERLNPKNSVLLVIDEKTVDSKTIIVSATYTTDEKLLDDYTDYSRIQIIDNLRKEGKQFREKTDKVQIMLEEKIKRE